MSNKRYLIIFGLFSVLFAATLWAVIAYFPLLYMDKEYATWLAKQNLIATPDQKQDVIIIGDSRAVAGINPLWSKFKVKNLALGGSTPVEGYFALERYLQHNPAPSQMVISYTPDHLIEGLFFNFSLKFHFLPYDDASEVVAQAVKLDDQTFRDAGNKLAVKDGQSKLSLYEYYSPTLYASALINGLFAARFLRNQQQFDDVIGSKGHTFYGSATRNDQINTVKNMAPSFQISKTIQWYLDRLIKLAQAQDIKIHLMIMPFNQASCDATKDIPAFAGYVAYMQQLNQRIEQVDPRQNNVPTPVLSCLSAEHFGDRSHLNALGAKWMTQQLDQQLSGGLAPN